MREILDLCPRHSERMYLFGWTGRRAERWPGSSSSSYDAARAQSRVPYSQKYFENIFSKSKSFSDERNAIASERSRADGRRDGRTRARMTPPELRAECRTLGNFSQAQVHFCPKERRCERSFGLLSETFRANVPFCWTSAGRKNVGRAGGHLAPPDSQP